MSILRCLLCDSRVSYDGLKHFVPPRNVWDSVHILSCFEAEFDFQQLLHLLSVADVYIDIPNGSKVCHQLGAIPDSRQCRQYGQYGVTGTYM